MCGRFTLTREDFAALAEELGAEADAQVAAAYHPRYNVAPTQQHIVVRAEDGRRRLRLAEWGLKRGQINARAETAAEKGTFRDAFASRRCVIPADGFYEWTGTGGQRTPIWYHAPSGGLLLLAGLYDVDGDRLRFTILTTRPNALVASVHDRMPAILPADRVDDWLARPAAELLGPAPESALVAAFVSRRANDVANDDPACLTPSAGPPQLKLF